MALPSYELQVIHRISVMLSYFGILILPFVIGLLWIDAKIFHYLYISKGENVAWLWGRVVLIIILGLLALSVILTAPLKS